MRRIWIENLSFITQHEKVIWFNAPGGDGQCF
jgi:hypothetical protein